jgi:hypothetical protein
MFKHIMVKGALALAAPAVAVLALGSAASAGPDAAQNVSFSASSDGASAHWASGTGSPIDLTIGTTGGSFAMVTLHHLSGPMPATAPTFATSDYNSGSPRWYITLSNGDYLFGYPSLGDVWETHGPHAGYTYTTYAGAEAAEGTANVTGAFVVADADQSPGTLDVITDLTFGGHMYN